MKIGRYEIDEDLLAGTRADGVARGRIVRPSRPVIVLGRSSELESELDAEAISKQPIDLLRRRGGGCSVLLDPGNLVVSLILPIPGFGAIKRYFRQISRWLSVELALCGIEGVRQEGVSDLVLGDRKIGGSCIFRTRDLLYYSTTLLVEPDIEAMERYLAHPPREPAYRQGRRHRDFVMGLAQISKGLDTPTLLAALAPRLTPSGFLDHLSPPP